MEVSRPGVAGWWNKAKVPSVKGHGDEIIKELSTRQCWHLARSDMPHYHHELLWMLLAPVRVDSALVRVDPSGSANVGPCRPDMLFCCTLIIRCCDNGVRNGNSVSISLLTLLGSILAV